MLHRPGPRRRKRRAKRGTAGRPVGCGLDRRLRRDAVAAAAACRRARAHPARGEARAGIRRNDRDTLGERSRRTGRRVRARAQLLQGAGRARLPRALAPVESGRRAAHRRAGAGYRPGRGRARSLACAGRPAGGARPAKEREAPALPVGNPGLLRNHGRRLERVGLLRPRQHRDAAPAGGRRRRAQMGPRPSRARRVHQRRRVRFFLRSAEAFLRRERRAVFADVRRSCWSSPSSSGK